MPDINNVKKIRLPIASHAIKNEIEFNPMLLSQPNMKIALQDKNTIKL